MLFCLGSGEEKDKIISRLRNVDCVITGIQGIDRFKSIIIVSMDKI